MIYVHQNCIFLAKDSEGVNCSSFKQVYVLSLGTDFI